MQNKSKYAPLFLVISLTILFSSGHVENPDTHLRLTQARLFVETGSIELERGIGDITHGNIAMSSSGERYSVYSPGQIMLFIPIYWVATIAVTSPMQRYPAADIMVSFLGYIVFGLTVLVFWKFGKSLSDSPRQRFITISVFAFTSYCFANAQDGYEQAYEALFLLLSLYFLNSKNTSLLYSLLAGLAFGLGMLFRPTILLALPGTMLIARTMKIRMGFWGGMVPFIIAIMAYNYIRFGNPIETGYSDAWLRAFGDITKFSVINIPKHLLGLVFSFGKGLLIFSPTLVLIFWSVRKFKGKFTRLFWGILLITACYILFYASNFAWHGSAWSWGPRYITPIVPLLYLILYRFNWIRKKWSVSLVVISLCVQLLAVSTFYKRDLIYTLTQNGDIFWTDDYFFLPKYSPIVGQTKSLWLVTESMITGMPKHAFQALGPWRNDERPATLEQMLSSSIDLNVYNFWWVRVQYQNVSNLVKYFSLGIMILFLMLSIVLVNNQWKAANTD